MPSTKFIYHGAFWIATGFTLARGENYMPTVRGVAIRIDLGRCELPFCGYHAIQQLKPRVQPIAMPYVQ